MTPRAPGSAGTSSLADARSVVLDYVRQGRAEPDAYEALARAGLASHVLRSLSASDAGGEGAANDPALTTARLRATVRHLAAKAAVVPLLGSWRALGIEVLVFKGFLLAEAVYREPADRSYTDVDLAVRPGGAGPSADWRDVASIAADAAAELGWRVEWRLGDRGSPDSYERTDYDGHEILQLSHDNGTWIDVHRWLVHNNVSVWASTSSQRLTTAVWESAVPLRIGNVEVVAPLPVDSALVGLMAARLWSGDRCVLRPHDYLDLSTLMEHGAVGRDDLLRRAGQLGLTRTARSFLRRCDPERRVLDLSTPSPLRLFWLDLSLVPERFPRSLAQGLFRAAALPESARLLVGAVAEVRRRSGAREADGRLESEHGGVGSRSGERPRKAELDKVTWVRMQTATRKALVMHGIVPRTRPRLALACLAGLARRWGHDVVVVNAGSQTWLSWDGRELPIDRLEIDPDPVLASEERPLGS